MLSVYELPAETLYGEAAIQPDYTPGAMFNTDGCGEVMEAREAVNLP